MMSMEKTIRIDQVNPGDIILDDTQDVYIVDQFEGYNNNLVKIWPKDCLGRALPICSYGRATEVTLLGRVK